MNFGTIQVANIFVGTLNAIEAYFGNEKVWGKSEPLCFTAEEANSTVAMKANGSAPTVSLEYSTDGNTWSPFVVGSTTVTLANISDKMWVRATSSGNTGMGSSDKNYNQFVMTGKISASGNVDTLLNQNGNATLTNYCYSHLFNGCTSLTTAPVLPATTLANNCYKQMFQGCTSLTTAPDLPATTLANYCYESMFYNTALTTAPELPATTLANGCYSNMFYGCTSLTSAPELPATTLASNCYRNMFHNCSSLTSAPELPATTLADWCYNSMFSYCSSLTTAPDLPATTLAVGCYESMFYGCTSLTQAPELPATTLAWGCYQNMFRNCTSLTTASALPATTLAQSCYQGVFYGCTNLNSIALGYTGNFSTTYFNNWVNGVASTGTFYYNGDDRTTGPNAIPTGWTVLQIPRPLCFTAKQANSTLRFDKVGIPNAISIETSVDGKTWKDYSWADKTGDTLTLANVGDKVYMRAKNENQTIGSSSSKYYKFKMTGKIAASGNIQTLLKTDGSRTDAPSNCYRNLFRDCPSLTQAPELPATTLDEACYAGMFTDCSSLTTATELPATTLANACYNLMFSGCTSLTTAPELPATTLANNCYQWMFSGCSNLNTITLGYTGNFADAPTDAFSYWVNGVASTGTFYYNGSDTTTGTSAIPEGWTVTPFTS